MNDTGSGSGPDGGDSGSWTTETLPLSVRRDLLERELKRLGFRKAGARSSASADSGGQQQQQPQDGGSSPPSADEGGGGHGD